MKKLIIIPAYNKMGNIVNAIKNIEKHAKSFEYVIINDCSTDDTRTGRYGYWLPFYQ